ncbi:flavodoxin family protein [bacterium]|nr:flavodoxin family protein [bacterium]
MRIISLVASPKGKKGNTARLLKHVLEGAEKQGAKNETIYLLGDSVLPCRACDACHIKGRCPQKDEFETIKNKILQSDGLILASPNYIFSVSAQLKAFMDRCCGVLHLTAFEGKYGASIVTSGGGDEEPIADYMNHFLMTTGIYSVGSVWATMSKFSGYEFPDDIKNKALELGENLVKAWKDKKTTPEFEKSFSKFKNRIRNLVTYRKDEWKYEYEIWEKNRNLT